MYYQWQSDPKHFDILVISWQFEHFWANNWQCINNLHRTTQGTMKLLKGKIKPKQLSELLLCIEFWLLSAFIWEKMIQKQKRYPKCEALNFVRGRRTKFKFQKITVKYMF